MGKSETQGTNAVQMATGVALGGLLALGVELMILLLGALAVSKGILKEDAAPQLTAAACVLGCFGGGLLACARWKSRRLLGAPAIFVGGGCLWGGAGGGFGGRGLKKTRPAVRKK